MGSEPHDEIILAQAQHGMSSLTGPVCSRQLTFTLYSYYSKQSLLKLHALASIGALTLGIILTIPSGVDCDRLGHQEVNELLVRSPVWA